MSRIPSLPGASSSAREVSCTIAIGASEICRSRLSPSADRRKGRRVALGIEFGEGATRRGDSSGSSVKGCPASRGTTCLRASAAYKLSKREERLVDEVGVPDQW